jgi:O-antigen/teichoic acid export membrane protein
MIFVGIDSLVPVFASLLLTGREQKLKEWSITITKYTAIFASLIFWAFVFIGPYAAPLVLGQDYSDTVPNGIWLLASLFPMAIAQLGYVFSVSYKRPLRYLLTLCCSFGVFIASSIVFIPVYGSVGCAIATLVSAVASSTIMFFSFRQQLGASILSGMVAILLWCVFVPFLLLRHDLVTDTLLVLVATAVYLAVLVLLHVVKLDEITTVMRAVRHRPVTS